MAEGGGKELYTEKYSQQEVKFKQLQECILQILISVISKLEHTHDKSRKIQLSKMKNLYAVLTNSEKKLTIETLMKCKGVLKKLMEKVDKVPLRLECSSSETRCGSTTAVGELTKTTTRSDRSESTVHDTLPKIRSENPSQTIQTGKSNSSKPNGTNDEAIPSNEWLPSYKSRTALQHMLASDSLRNLYKCMDRKCYWTKNDAHTFLHHIRSKHFSKTHSEWNRCCYCSFQGDGTPQDLVQHITKKHGHCQYQCAYCFFRGMACSFVVLHQRMFHTNKLARVLQCNDLKVSPPAESELEPFESVVLPYICKQGSCDRIFYNPKDFLLHLKHQHDQISTLTCHICKATRLKAVRLISHYKFHSLSLYQCRHCLYGAEKEEEIHQHLCNVHPSLPPLTVLRHCGLSKQSAPDADVNQLKIVNLEQSLLGDDVNRPSESTVEEVMTSIHSEISPEEGTVDTNETADILSSQMTEREIVDILQNASFEMMENKVTDAAQECPESPILKDASLLNITPLKISSSLQETNAKGKFSDSSPYRKPDTEKNDNNDGGLLEDNDVQVVYCQLAMKGKNCKRVTCKGSCKLRISQPGTESPVKEITNSVSELISDTDSQSSSDSVILLTESWPEATAKEECKLAQERTNHEAVLVSTPKKFISPTLFQKAETEFNIDSESERNICPESVNTAYIADKPQKIRNCEESAVTENSVMQADQQKQFTASGLTGKDLYLCGNAQCEYRAATKSQLREHMYVCDLSREGVFRCPHCFLSFKAFNTMIDHVSVHGVPRYTCALCTYCDTAPTAVEKHLKHLHKVSCTETIPIDRFLNNHDADMFVVSPKGKDKSKYNSAALAAESMYRPEERQILPTNEVLEEPIKCSECSFKRNVCSNMKQHLGQHLDRDLNPAHILRMQAVKPVVCPEQNEKMFDKMTNVAPSSDICVQKLTSSVTSNSSHSTLSAGATDDLGKSGKDVQDAASATTSKPTKQTHASRTRASVPDLSEPLSSSSLGGEVQDGAKQATDLQARKSIFDVSESAAAAIPSLPSKRAAALRARASIHDLSDPVDVAAVIMYQPKMRAAAARAMASIRDLSELALTTSPKNHKDSDTEEPGTNKKEGFTLSSQPKKKSTSKKRKVSCKNCGKRFKNERALKLHIKKKHNCTEKWLCGYCHQGGSTKMAIKEHCRLRHHNMPELVKYKEATSLTLDKLEETDRQTKLTELQTADEAHRSKRKSSQLLQHEETHFNKKISITTSTAHYFECYECSFRALSLHLLRKHFGNEHTACAFRYIVKSSKLPGDRIDNVRPETFAVKHHSTRSKLCDAGHYICMLCSARTDSEEQFHTNHHSVHHPNVEPKYYFETVGHDAKHTKFECQKCCFTSDNFEILKEHLQLHIIAFQIWLSAQQCDLESKVIKPKFSDCDFGEMELGNGKKFVIQGNLGLDKSLCPAVSVSENKDTQRTQCRIALESTASSSVSTRNSLSANKSEEDCSEIPKCDDPNTESSNSTYGQSSSPIDKNRLLVFANYDGSFVSMTVSTFSKLHNIYPKVKVQDLKHVKLAPV